MRKGLLVSINALILTLGCGGSPVVSPLNPTQLTTTSEPSCSPRITCEILPFRMSGIATDDEGRPVAGVKVTVNPWIFAQSTTPISTTTDIAGFYRIGFEAMRDAVGGVGSAVANQPGYETDGRYLGPQAAQEFTQNFHLYRTKRITPGESVSVTVLPDDTFCGFSDEWRCRTFRIVSPMAGILSATLVSHNAQDATGLEMFVVRNSPGVVVHRCCASEVSLEVEAGAEIITNVLVWWATRANHSFTLNTKFEGHREK